MVDLLDNLSTVLHQSAEKLVLVDLSDLRNFIEARGRGGGIKPRTWSVSLPEYNGGSCLAVKVRDVKRLELYMVASTYRTRVPEPGSFIQPKPSALQVGQEPQH